MDVSGGEMGESPDPDEGKPRATVKQYAALIAQKVMTHLEGLAQARVEKRPRPYQTDAEIHQSYIKATSGGGGGDMAEDDPEGGPTAGEAPQKSQEVFPLLRGDFDTEEMRAILDFEHKPRPTPLLKELLSLPFMDKQAVPPVLTEKTEQHRAEGTLWRGRYQKLADAPVHEKLDLKRIQEEALEVNAEEDHIERIEKPTRRLRGKHSPVASFASEGLYERPSAFIRHLISQLPADARLSRLQICACHTRIYIDIDIADYAAIQWLGRVEAI